MQLKNNERIDDLQIDNLKIIQNKEWFCFGIDSVLLANFAREENTGSNILDLGSGTGIIGILLSSKIKNSKITGIEVQEEVAEMSKRSVKLNDLENKIEILNMNIKDFKSKNKYDVVVSNPPYKEQNTGLLNENNIKLISRHEIKANLEDFIIAASSNLKEHGNFYMVNRPERLVDIFELCRKYKMEPKILQMVYSKVGSKPTLILVKATKNGNKYLKVIEPLYIYNENGEYTEKILKIYEKNNKEGK